MRHDRKWSWGRFFKRLIVVVAIIFLLLIIVASPLTKYLVQKYDVEYTGREITLGNAFVNPLAGSLALRNLKMYEADSDTVFFSAGKFKANMSVLRLIRGIYDVSSIRINRPEIVISRDDTIFNFTDILEKFAVTEDTVEEEQLKLNIRNIRIDDGSVYYTEKSVEEELAITEIYFRSPGMFWDVDSINAEFSLVPGGGKLSGDFMLNQETMDYRLSMNLADFGLEPVQPFLAAMTDNASITASLDMELNARGNFNQLVEGTASGNFDLRNFHFGPGKTDYFSLNRFLVQFREVNLAENRFYFDSILIDKPKVLYQMYDTLDNFRRMFQSQLAEEAEEEAEEAADTVDMLVNLLGSDYYIHNFSLNEAAIEFNDYSIAEKFSISIDPLNIKADTIDKSTKRVNVEFDGRLKPYGRFAATISMDPDNEENLDMEYEFRDISASMFNPYIATYTSYQLDRGEIEMHGEWHIRNSVINALNHFLVIDPQDTKRVRGKDTKWVPLPLIMSFVRERGSVIDYQIPVKGDLNSPDFKLGDIISDILRNILVKPPTTPYRLQVQNVENKIEKTLSVKWKMRQHAIEEGQERFMKDIAKFMKENPEARLIAQPVFHVAKEKENLLLFEAKKKYYIQAGKSKEKGSLSERDSMDVEKLSSKDPDFIRYLDKSFKNPEFITLQAKCYSFVGEDVVDKKYNDLVEKRRNEFLKYFRENNSEDRVEVLEVKNQVPFNWFSYYDINYKGDIPEELAEAYNKLREINSEPPRSEFFEPPRR